MTAITHLAGNRITIGPYAIQRCLLCGEVLDEYNARNIMSADGSGGLTQFAVGGFYEFEGNCRALIKETESPNFNSDLDIPDNCCIRQRWEDEG